MNFDVANAPGTSSTRMTKNADTKEFELMISFDNNVNTLFSAYGMNSSFLEYSSNNAVKLSKLFTDDDDSLNFAVECESPKISTPGT